MRNRLTKENIRFLKFAVVGISGTIVDFSIFNLMLILDFNSLYASAISFSIAVFNNFFWNRIWTYPESRSEHVGSQLLMFGIVSTAGLIIRTYLYKIIEPQSIATFENLFENGFAFSPVTVGQNISLAIVIIVVLFWNYLLNRFWTYRNV